MNQHHCKLIVLGLLGVALWAQIGTAQSPAKPLKARPIQIISCAEVPAAIDYSLKPMGYEPGFEIFYLVKGENLVRFKKDSLVMKGIRTPEGKELSKNPQGKPTYEQGPFPKISKERDYALFSLKVDQVQFGRCGIPSIKRHHHGLACL